MDLTQETHDSRSCFMEYSIALRAACSSFSNDINAQEEIGNVRADELGSRTPWEGQAKGRSHFKRYVKINQPQI